MRKFQTLFALALLLLCFMDAAKAQIVNIPDPNFKAALLSHIPAINTNGDSEIQYSEAAAFSGSLWLSSRNISNLIGIEAFTAIRELYCAGNQLGGLYLNSNTALTTLDCSGNQLLDLHLISNTALTNVSCGGNQIGMLNLTFNTALTSLNCEFNRLVLLDITNNSALVSLNCSSNQLTSLDLSGCPSLASLTCSNNQFSSLDITQNPLLTTLYCGNNDLTSIDFSNCPLMSTLDCSSNQFSLLDLTPCTVLYSVNCEHNLLSSLNLSAPTTLRYLYCNNNLLPSLNLSAHSALRTVNCSNNLIPLLDLSAATLLNTLNCSSNLLPALDVTQNTALTNLNCSGNQLPVLDLSNNTALTTLNCSSNQLPALDLSTNNVLSTLYCGNNQLPSLDVAANPALVTLNCESNQLSYLNLATNTLLKYLYCRYNQLSSLELQTNTLLRELFCNNNQLSSLDLRVNTAINKFDCRNNQLLSLDLRNGNNTAITMFNYTSTGNSNLSCVSVDNPSWSTSNWTSRNAQTQFSSNCSCGVYAINIDMINGVDCGGFGQINASVSGGNGPFQYDWINAPLSTDSVLLADTAGIYTLRVTDANLCEGFRKIVLDGPKVDGVELNANLQAGIFRPGRTTGLNLSALNDGCLVQNVELQLVFNGPLNFESAVIPPTSQHGDTLTWSLGSMEYTLDDFFSALIFRTDTLAQAGNLVCFELSITPLAGDADSSNNQKSYCYPVVNSYDPNDLQVYPQGACAEHYTLKDQPLSYTIRFQNTGNAPAIDVFLIDTLPSMLNINSVRVISSSHEPMITEIIGNQVLKFNFKDINLADSLSDEAGSKGYVTFEIDPYAGLNEGQVVENTVGIYFDFNPPVITNTTYNTLVSVLPASDTTVIYDTLNPIYSFEGHRYPEAGTYHRHFSGTGGCDSLLVLHLARPLPVYGTDVQSACGSYTWIDGNTYTSDNNTATYIFAGGASHGGDSIVTLDLHIYSPSNSALTETVCASYTAPDGQVYTSSGLYTAVIPNALGCDSTISIDLTVNYPSTSTIVETACSSYTAPDGQVYTSSGMYTAIIPNVIGCDSTITIDLTVNFPSTSAITETACSSYTAPDGQVYTSSGTYTAVIPNALGCDSTITIDLTVNYPSTSAITETACSSYTAPDGQVYTSSGTYTAVIPNSMDCDSTITIDLTVNHPSTSAITETACTSYTAPDGQVYTSSGTYTAVIPNGMGCDSTISISLSINQSSSSVISETACFSYTAPDGQVYTSSGMYTAIIPNAAGCDSIILIHLTIQTVNTGLSVSDPVITADASGAVYQWLNCGAGFTEIAGETSSVYTAAHNGQYAVLITENGCTDTSSCVLIANAGLTEHEKARVHLFPNPTDGLFHLDFGRTYELVSLKITDSQGREISREILIKQETASLKLEEAPGIYFVTLVLDKEEKLIIRLLKN